MPLRLCLIFVVLCVGSMANAMNTKIVGVKTLDNVQVMLLKKYVEESHVIKDTIHSGEKWYLARVAMTQEEFNRAIPYLKLGAAVTRIKQEVSREKNALMRRELEPNIEFARRELIDIIDRYSKKEWTQCIKSAIALRIDTVFDAAAAVGKKKNWFKKPPQPVEVNNSN